MPAANPATPRIKRFSLVGTWRRSLNVPLKRREKAFPWRGNVETVVVDDVEGVETADTGASAGIASTLLAVCAATGPAIRTTVTQQTAVTAQRRCSLIVP